MMFRPMHLAAIAFLPSKLAPSPHDNCPLMLMPSTILCLSLHCPTFIFVIFILPLTFPLCFMMILQPPWLAFARTDASKGQSQALRFAGVSLKQRVTFTLQFDHKFQQKVQIY